MRGDINFCKGKIKEFLELEEGKIKNLGLKNPIDYFKVFKFSDLINKNEYRVDKYKSFITQTDEDAMPLAKFIYFVLWSEDMPNNEYSLESLRDNAYDINYGEIYGSETINTYVSLFGEFSKEETEYKAKNLTKIKKIFDTDEELCDKIDKFLDKCFTIGNFMLLKESILLDAVQGKLVQQNPTDEPAFELLKRIKAEKEQLIKTRKIKKEKPLAPIAEDEKPFEIPKHWEWISLGDIFQHNTGKALNSSHNIGEKYKYITTSNLYWNKFELDSLRDMYFGDSEIEKYTIKKGDLLVLEGGDIGRAAIWNYDYNICFQNHIHRLRPYNNICIKFFYYLFLLYKLAGFIGGRGIGIQSLSSNAIHRIIFPFPPLAEQQRIVNKIDKLMEFIETLEKNNNLVKERAFNLLKSIEKSFLSEYPCKNINIIDIKEKRAILSAEIISQLYNEQYFGAIKLEKILYLCETHLKISLGGDYKQEAAGPHDAQSRYEVEDILKNKKWFSVHKEQKSNIEVTKYTPLEKSNEISEIFNKVFSAEVTEINNLLELFRGKNSDFCESVATLYAVWLNRLSKNLSCTDADLISDFKAWSDPKSRFYDSDLQDRILFMRRKNLIPNLNIK